MLLGKLILKRRQTMMLQGKTKLLCDGRCTCLRFRVQATGKKALLRAARFRQTGAGYVIWPAFRRRDYDLLILYNQGQLVQKPVQLKNTADATVYSQAKLGARNQEDFVLYTNRAMVANEVSYWPDGHTEVGQALQECWCLYRLSTVPVSRGTLNGNFQQYSRSGDYSLEGHGDGS